MCRSYPGSLDMYCFIWTSCGLSNVLKRKQWTLIFSAVLKNLKRHFWSTAEFPALKTIRPYTSFVVKWQTTSFFSKKIAQYSIESSVDILALFFALQIIEDQRQTRSMHCQNRLDQYTRNTQTTTTKCSDGSTLHLPVCSWDILQL